MRKQKKRGSALAERRLFCEFSSVKLQILRLLKPFSEIGCLDEQIRAKMGFNEQLTAKNPPTMGA